MTKLKIGGVSIKLSENLISIIVPVYNSGSKSFKMNGIGYDASGNSLLGIGSVYNYVDNLYVQYLIQYGILFMIIILAGE